MLSGKFVNCYGLMNFDMPEINFTSCNKAMIYATNGIMKSSLSKVFEDISKGQPTSDRIFKDSDSSYSVSYYASEFKSDKLEATDHIYVVNSFSDRFDLPKETMTTLLADEMTRKSYDILMSEFSSEIKEFEKNVSALSGLTKPKIK